jgi:hypothetical protein
MLCRRRNSQEGWRCGLRLFMKRVLRGRASGSLAVVIGLGTTQTIAWASSYYLPAVLAASRSSLAGRRDATRQPSTSGRRRLFDHLVRAHQ